MDVSKWESSIDVHQHFVASRLQETADNISRSQLEDCFCNLIKTNNAITQELINILILIQTHQKNTRIVKTTGVTVGAAGTLSMVAGLLMTPVTGGISGILSIGGLIAAVTSGATAIGAEVGSRIRSKSFIENIEKLQNKQQKAINELILKLGIINQIVEELTNVGVNEEVAITATISYMKNRISQICVGPNGEISPRQLAEVINRILNYIKNLRPLASASVVVYAAAGTTFGQLARETSAAVSSITGKIGRITTIELKNLKQLLQSGGQAATSTTGKIMLKRVGAVVGIVFTVIDVALLVKEWRSPHPLILHIQKVVDVLMSDVDKCNEMVVLLHRLNSSSLSQA